MTRIAILPGDGIGPEVIAEARACIELLSARCDLALSFEEHPIGGAAIDLMGEPLPASTLAACKSSDAILLGAIGGPGWDNEPRRPEAALLELRRELGLYANLRPARVLSGLEHLSPLRRHVSSGADILVVRELSGGLYYGEKRKDSEKASDACVYTRGQIERIACVAFDAARRRRRHVTSIDKANVLATSRLWRETVVEVASAYPDVGLDHLYVDAAAMAMVTCPRRFDVLLTENMFGDILSDQTSVIGGSIGLLPSASLGEGGPALFEPVHGSAPDIAGTDRANPAAAIGSAAMLLSIGLGMEEAGSLLERSLESVLRSGCRTRDLGGDAGCSQFGEAVRDELERQFRRMDAHSELIAMNRGCCA